MTKRGSLSNVKSMHTKPSKNSGFIFLLTIGITAIVTLTIIVGGVFVYKIDQEMMLKMQQKQLIQPTKFYSRATTWKVGDQLPLDQIQNYLNKQLRLRSGKQHLFAGDFSVLRGNDCFQVLNKNTELIETDQCLQIFWDKGEHPLFKVPWLETLWIDSNSQVKGVFRGQELESINQFTIPPQIIAQYLGGEPILRDVHQLSEVPVTCLNAIMSIEDPKFLEHSGVSPIGILLLFTMVKI